MAASIKFAFLAIYHVHVCLDYCQYQLQHHRLCLARANSLAGSHALWAGISAHAAQSQTCTADLKVTELALQANIASLQPAAHACTSVCAQLQHHRLCLARANSLAGSHALWAGISAHAAQSQTCTADLKVTELALQANIASLQPAAHACTSVCAQLQHHRLCLARANSLAGSHARWAGISAHAAQSQTCTADLKVTELALQANIASLQPAAHACTSVCAQLQHHRLCLARANSLAGSHALWAGISAHAAQSQTCTADLKVTELALQANIASLQPAAHACTSVCAQLQHHRLCLARANSLAGSHALWAGISAHAAQSQTCTADLKVTELALQANIASLQPAAHACTSVCAQLQHHRLCLARANSLAGSHALWAGISAHAAQSQTCTADLKVTELALQANIASLQPAAHACTSVCAQLQHHRLCLARANSLAGSHALWLALALRLLSLKLALQANIASLQPAAHACTSVCAQLQHHRLCLARANSLAGSHALWAGISAHAAQSQTCTADLKVTELALQANIASLQPAAHACTSVCAQLQHHRLCLARANSLAGSHALWAGISAHAAQSQTCTADLKVTELALQANIASLQPAAHACTSVCAQLQHHRLCLARANSLAGSHALWAGISAHAAQSQTCTADLKVTELALQANIASLQPAAHACTSVCAQLQHHRLCLARANSLAGSHALWAGISAHAAQSQTCTADLKVTELALQANIASLQPAAHACTSVCAQLQHHRLCLARANSLAGSHALWLALALRLLSLKLALQANIASLQPAAHACTSVCAQLQHHRLCLARANSLAGSHALWAGISAHAAQSQTCTADLKVTELALQANIASLQPAAHACTSVCAQLQHHRLCLARANSLAGSHALWAGISAHAAQSQTCTADLKVTELALQANIASLQPAAHACTSVCAQLQHHRLCLARANSLAGSHALWAGISAHAAQSQTCTADLKVTELALQANIASLQPAAHACTSVCAQLQHHRLCLARANSLAGSHALWLALALRLLSLKLALQANIASLQPAAHACTSVCAQLQHHRLCLARANSLAGSHALWAGISAHAAQSQTCTADLKVTELALQANIASLQPAAHACTSSGCFTSCCMFNDRQLPAARLLLLPFRHTADE